MKLRIGDKVKVLNEVGEGTVSRIRDRNTVFVAMPDGFEIPYDIRELVPVENELLRADTENIGMDPEMATPDAVYLAIEPDLPGPATPTGYKLYLFNASSFNLKYVYSAREDAYFQTLKHGDAGAYQKILLRQVAADFFASFSQHKIECLLFRNTSFRAQTPIAETINLSPAVLRSTGTVSHDEFDKPVYIFLLKDDFNLPESAKEIGPALDRIDADALKRNMYGRDTHSPRSKPQNRHKSQERVVDLHIHELLESTKGMSNFEMLSVQLERFEKELDAAIENGVRKITFIHGVGNGRLKQEIISTLKDTPNVTFFDAPFKLYGYGATEVHLH